MYGIICLMLFAVGTDCFRFIAYEDSDIYANRSTEVILKWKYVTNGATIFRIECKYHDGNEFVTAVKKINENKPTSVNGNFQPFTDNNDKTVIGIKIAAVTKTAPTKYRCDCNYNVNNEIKPVKSTEKMLYVLDPPAFKSCLSEAKMYKPFLDYKGELSLGPVKYKGDLKFSCNVFGIPEPTLQCHLENMNYKTLASFPSQEKKGNISGQFNNVPENARFVRCIAKSDKAGKIEKRIAVFVEHPPFAPSNFTQVTSTENSIKLRWSNLNKTSRGGAILNYVMKYKVSTLTDRNITTKTLTQQGSNTNPGYKKDGDFFTYEVMGLSRSLPYTFMLFATNREGNGKVATLERIRAGYVAEPSERSGERDDLPAIIGGVVGGVVLLVLVVILVVWCSRREKSPGKSSYPTSYVEDAVDYPASNGQQGLYANATKSNNGYNNHSPDEYPLKTPSSNSYEQSEKAYV